MKKQIDEKVETPITSMIDVVFLLIIFFVVTSAIDQEAVDTSIVLAKSYYVPPPEKRDPRTVTVNVKYINDEKEVKGIDDALKGARDIIAERISEDAEVRGMLRNLFWKEGVITTKVLASKKEKAEKYRDYFDWSEAIRKAPSHRVLAMRRGEKETFLSLDIQPDEENAIAIIDKKYVLGNNAASEQIELAVKDGYKRLLRPSMETETRMTSKNNADEEAIKVFVDNAKELLMA